MADNKDKHVFLSLSPNRATAESGWSRRQGPYDDQYIEQIIDPSDGVPKRLLTAIPSPFARIHLFDTAFNFVCARDRQGRFQHEGSSVFHKTVSDCLDVLELLFVWNQAPPVVIERWSPDHDLPLLEDSERQPDALSNPLNHSQADGQRLLASVLKLFLEQDAESAHFNLQPSFTLLTVAREVIALSSPLTFFITSPSAQEIADVHGLINPSTGDSFFSEARPLHSRPADFQFYVHWLFSRNRPLRRSSRRMYTYVTQSLEILKRTNIHLANQIKELEHGRPDELKAQFGETEFEQLEELLIAGAELYRRPQNDV